MKPVTDEQKRKLLSLTESDMTVTNITRLFSKHTKLSSTKNRKFEIIPPEFDVRSPMHLDAGEYINIEAVDTTVGIFLFNKIMIEYGMIAEIVPNHYFNEVVNKKKFDLLTDTYIASNLTSGKLPIYPNYIKFLKQYEFFGLKLSTLFSPSYTRGLLETNEKIQEKKKELTKGKKYNTIKEMTDTEDELVAFARDVLKDDPGMTLFDSGARGSFENDYKNMNLMLGPVANPITGKFTMVENSYNEGLSRDDIVAAGNIVVNSAFPKAVGTQRGGFKTKEFYAGFQSIVVDEDGTNCGTNVCLEVTLNNDKDFKFYEFQNIMDGDKIVPLTADTKDKYMGKKIRLRTPMACTSEKRCSVCMGRRPYIMDQENYGLTAGRVSNTLVNKAMKNFHVSKIVLDEIDLDTLLI